MPGSSVPPETAEGGPAAENASTVDHLGIGFADSWDGGAGLRAARHEVAFQKALVALVETTTFAPFTQHLHPAHQPREVGPITCAAPLRVHYWLWGQNLFKAQGRPEITEKTAWRNLAAEGFFRKGRERFRKP